MLQMYSQIWRKTWTYEVRKRDIKLCQVEFIEMKSCLSLKMHWIGSTEDNKLSKIEGHWIEYIKIWLSKPKQENVNRKKLRQYQIV